MYRRQHGCAFQFRALGWEEGPGWRGNAARGRRIFYVRVSIAANRHFVSRRVVVGSAAGAFCGSYTRMNAAARAPYLATLNLGHRGSSWQVGRSGVVSAEPTGPVGE